MIIRVVLDTNILVSALWTPAGNASDIIKLILSDKIIPCFDRLILDEYKEVLSRPRLAFPPGQADEFLTDIIDRGISAVVRPSAGKMPDEADRKFYDIAKHCEAYLVTGNLRHFPKDPRVTSPAQFLDIYKQKSE